MTNGGLDSERRRNILKTGAVALTTGLAGCQNLLDGDNSTSTPTDSPSATDEPTPTETKTPEPTDWEQLLEDNVEHRDQAWNNQPLQKRYIGSSIDVWNTQRSIAKHQDLEIKNPYGEDDWVKKHSLGETGVEWANIRNGTETIPKGDGNLFSWNVQNEIGSEIQKNMEEEYEVKGTIDGHPYFKTVQSFMYNSDENVYFQSLDTGKLALGNSVLEGDHPSMTGTSDSELETYPWIGSRPYQNNIITAAVFEGSHDNSIFSDRVVRTRFQNEEEYETAVQCFIYEPDKDITRDVVFIYNGQDWEHYREYERKLYETADQVKPPEEPAN